MKQLMPILFLATPALADAPVVQSADIRGSSIHVTISHPDTGWDHYADKWVVRDQNGNLLAERVLAHPHVQEQPFTRSTPLIVPSGTESLHIVAQCTDGDHSETYVLQLDQ